MSFLDGQISLHLHYGEANRFYRHWIFQLIFGFLMDFLQQRTQKFGHLQSFSDPRLSVHKARLATFTVAASVRSSLADALALHVRGLLVLGVSAIC